MEHGEIVVYKTAQDSGLKLAVRVENETIWLTQQQIADLFGTKRPAITKHLKNIYKSGELAEHSTCSILEHMGAGGVQKYKTRYYNLDAILSVGYRVNSKNATQFRIWANKILKEYLLRGHVYNYRFEKIERKLVEHDQKFELIINTGLKPTEGIFYDGQIFDAWEFVSGLIKEAKQSIVLIDNYIDESVLALLAKRQAGVKASIYTASITKQLKHDLARHNNQYPAIQAHAFNKAHDRFLIIDEETVYHIGASLKDLGKKWFAFSKINLDAVNMLERLKEK
jgi:hypothetical protein